MHRGETIRLELVSDDAPYSLLIRPLGINVTASKSHPGDTLFTATQAGDFDVRCGDSAAADTATCASPCM